MSPARELPARDYAALKLGTSDLLALAGGTRRAEKHTRVSHQQLGNYASETDPRLEDVFVPVDVLADLEAELVARGHRPVLTEILADLAGYLLTPKPEMAGFESDEEGLLRVAKESTEAVAAGWAARSDGGVTPEERRHVTRQLREAIHALVEVEHRWSRGGDEE